MIANKLASLLFAQIAAVAALEVTIYNEYQPKKSECGLNVPSSSGIYRVFNTSSDTTGTNECINMDEPYTGTLFTCVEFHDGGSTGPLPCSSSGNFPYDGAITAYIEPMTRLSNGETTLSALEFYTSKDCTTPETESAESEQSQCADWDGEVSNVSAWKVVENSYIQPNN